MVANKGIREVELVNEGAVLPFSGVDGFSRGRKFRQFAGVIVFIDCIDDAFFFGTFPSGELSGLRRRRLGRG